MTDVHEYEVTTDYGVMRFTSEDIVGYWWKQNAQEMNSERLESETKTRQYNLLAAYHVAKDTSLTASDHSERFFVIDPELSTEFKWFSSQLTRIRELLIAAGVKP